MRAELVRRALLLGVHARESLWYRPALFALGAVALSTASLHLDSALGTGFWRGFWLFSGNADGARAVLSVIAGSLITVIAVAFSVTALALQQASSQFTPRVLRRFTSDRGNQYVLAIYIATFCFALLVLRRVREGREGLPAFVPSISISTAMLLALISLFALIYFIHHLSESLQLGHLLQTISDELDAEINRLFPERLGKAGQEGGEGFVPERALPADPGVLAICCDGAGYLRDLDTSQLSNAARQHFLFLRIEVEIGEYLYPGQVVARGVPRHPVTDGADEAVLGALQLDRDRSLRQDPLFGLQQLVDIGVKALSPGINDPTTAEQVLDHLGRCLSRLAERSIPGALRVVDDTRILLKVPDFRRYVDAAFAQLRAAARHDLHVTLHLASVLRKLAQNAATLERRALLRHELEVALDGLDVAHLTMDEREKVRRARRLDGGGPIFCPADAAAAPGPRPAQRSAAERRKAVPGRAAD